MPDKDVFLSYAREDLEKARQLAAALEENGWSVWWDHSIPPGTNIHTAIQGEIDSARCVIVLWSHHSVASEWVIEEAETGRNRRVLIPVSLDPTEELNLPVGFRTFQALGLHGWDGSASHAGLKPLYDSVERLVLPATAGVSGEGYVELEKFRVVRRLGRGGMGVVYEAIDTTLDRQVAIKVLMDGATMEEESRTRFERESRAAARLQHPNIVTIYEFGSSHLRSNPYIVMEYIEGKDLASLGSAKLYPSQTLRVGKLLCDALDYAHRNGVVHRDVKPSNIRVVENGDVKLMDFGIARIEGSHQMTKAGVLLGTLHYMSPEQAIGGEVDGRSDIFSLGAVLYELLAGEKPFPGESATSILYKIVNETPKSLSEIRPDLSEDLIKTIEGALAKTPDERFQTAAALGAELERCAAQVKESNPGRLPVRRKARQPVSQQELQEIFQELQSSFGDTVHLHRGRGPERGKQHTPSSSTPREVASPHAFLSYRRPRECSAPTGYTSHGYSTMVHSASPEWNKR